MLDYGSAATVAALVINGLGVDNDLLAGGIGDGGAAARIRVCCIIGIGASEQGSGGKASAAVDLLAPQHAAGSSDNRTWASASSRYCSSNTRSGHWLG